MHLPEREIQNPSEITSVLTAGRFATIAMARGNEPYLVTLSYGYDAEANALYFHSAHEGLKLEFLAANPHVCATVIIDRGYRDGMCSHSYSSVVMTGTMGLVDDPEARRHGMRKMTEQLESHPAKVYAKHKLDGDAVYKRMAVLKLQIETIRGKAGS